MLVILSIVGGLMLNVDTFKAEEVNTSTESGAEIEVTQADDDSTTSETTTAESKYIIDTQVSWPEINQSFEEENDANKTLEFDDEAKQLIQDQIGIIKENSKESSIFVQVANQQLSTNEDATTVLPADDLMKLFIAAVYFHQIETKQITAEDSVEITEQDIIEGNALANLPLNKAYKLSMLVQLMLQSHDNMATDILIKTLGGVDKVNQQIKELGFIQTSLANLMVDELSGNVKKYNETSASDLANLLLALFQGVLFEESINAEALAMYSQHGPIGIANQLENNQLFYGLKAKSMRDGVLNDALLYEVEKGTPVVIVVMSNQLDDGDNRLDNLGYQLNHIIKR